MTSTIMRTGDEIVELYQLVKADLDELNETRPAGGADQVNRLCYSQILGTLSWVLGHKVLGSPTEVFIREARKRRKTDAGSEHEVRADHQHQEGVPRGGADLPPPGD